MKYIFFGSSDISVTTLQKLKENNLLPTLIVTKPDRPKGRGLEITESVVKTWAKENNIPFETPEKIRDDAFLEILKKEKADLGILVSFGKIIPKKIIDIFPKGIINIHPSLLPLLRGPAPFEYSILELQKENIGITIMLLDEGMDSGDILVQQKVDIPDWPIKKNELYNLLSQKGAELLIDTLPKYLKGEIIPTKQTDSEATFSKMVKKEDGCLNLEDDDYKNFLKYLAFEGWPGTFFFLEKNGKTIRVKITNAEFADGKFKIKKVIPEGKKEISFEDFERNN